MRLSVILATMNRPEDLRKVFDSLLTQTRIPEEIWVVDQSTSAGTKDLTVSYQARFLEKKSTLSYYFQEEKSLVKARNRGLSLANGDVISFLDDDIVLFEDYFEKILQVWRDHPDTVAVSGNTLIRESLKGARWTLRRLLNRIFLLSHFDGKMTASGFGYPIYEREIDRLLTVEMLPGCNMNFKRSAIGDDKFDEWFTGYSYREDAEYSYRVSKKGRVLMTPDAKLWHNYSTVSRLTEEQLKPMKIKNYHYVFRKFKGEGWASSLLFGYSLLGLVFIDIVEYLSQRTPSKWGKLKAGVAASFSVWKRP